jgi:D-alanyl-D-alanine endopeptidase (penicillin-binding protein 7)
VIPTRLLRSVRLICALASLAVPGLQSVAVAQTATPRGPSQTQPRLQLARNQSAPQPAGEGITHVVRRGETLWSISKRYGTTVAAVQRWNGLRGSTIQPGRRLEILTGRPTAAAAPPGEPVTHVIRRGETLSSIARRYGTTVAAVQAWNGLRGSVIQAGRRLEIFTGRPAAAAAPPGEPVTHVIRRGETLSSIARRYGTTVAAVQAWNGLRGSVIQTGRRLSIFATSPAEPQTTASSRGEQVTHVIQRGETLSSISRFYGTTVADVRGWNGIRGSIIQAGRRLTIFSTRPGARWAASLQGLRFRVDEHGDQVPDLRAAAAIIYNPATGQVLWEENSQNQRSIASITKVMTATVFLEASPDLSREVVIDRADVRRASVTYLRAGDTLTTGDLLHLLLIPSDNGAARALARVSPLGSTGFIARMNEKAAELGLTNTHYTDPSGLDSDNVSSAYDMARLMAYAGGDIRIAGVMQKQSHTVTAGPRTIRVRSTNQLVRTGDVDVVGGKTGYIRRAGYCLAALLRLPEGGPQVAVVVLGARSSAARFLETRQLFSWLESRAQDLLGTPVQASVAGL